MLNVFKKKLKRVTTNPLLFTSICCYFFIFVFTIILFGYNGQRTMYGTYECTNGNITEVLQFSINNKVKYKMIVDGTEKDNSYSNQIVKWKSTTNKKELDEFSSKGYDASLIQIKLCNDSWASYFQLFRMGDGTLITKPNQFFSEEQKCFTKK